MSDGSERKLTTVIVCALALAGYLLTMASERLSVGVPRAHSLVRDSLPNAAVAGANSWARRLKWSPWPLLAWEVV